TKEDLMSKKRKRQALAELRAELAEFAPDGLVQLAEDLEECRVLRGTWAGCVISYKRGYAGSVRQDRKGRARNAFTALWDEGWLTEDEVRAEVLAEIERRRKAHTLPGHVAGVA